MITNEIYDALGRNPDQQEYQNFMNYVYDTIQENNRLGKKTFLIDVEHAILEYRDDNYKQCCDCGEYYLADSDEWNDDGEHCLNCKPHQDYDTMADYLHDESVCDEVMGY
jgi:hypothetical protein